MVVSLSYVTLFRFYFLFPASVVVPVRSLSVVASFRLRNFHRGILTTLVELLLVREVHSLRCRQCWVRKREIPAFKTRPAIELPIVVWNYGKCFSDLKVG